MLRKLKLRIQEIFMRFSRNYPGVKFIVPGNVKIGNRVSIAADVMLSADSPISIGDDTLIAARAIINTATHEYRNHPVWKQRISRPISIGRHVWIGSNAIILPGIRVGDFAVVGAGAVVTRHVPDRAIVVGSPARLIGFRELPLEDLSCKYPGVAVYADFLPDSLVVKAADGLRRTSASPPL